MNTGGSNVFPESQLWTVVVLLFCPFLAHVCSASHPSWQKRNVSKHLVGTKHGRKVNRSKGWDWASVYDWPCRWHSPWNGLGRDLSILPDSIHGHYRGWCGSGTANSRSLNAGSLFQRLELFCPQFSSADVVDASAEEMFISLCSPHTQFCFSPVPWVERVIEAIFVMFSESLVLEFLSGKSSESFTPQSSGLPLSKSCNGEPCT